MGGENEKLNEKHFDLVVIYDVYARHKIVPRSTSTNQSVWLYYSSSLAVRLESYKWNKKTENERRHEQQQKSSIIFLSKKLTMRWKYFTDIMPSTDGAAHLACNCKLKMIQL